ncbi:MAG: radical SAM protein [Candidatus Heimdallarchaeaceae archaeon]
MFISPNSKRKTVVCEICKGEKVLASVLAVCNSCLKKFPETTAKNILDAHKNARGRVNLPATPPQSVQANCILCNHFCGIGENETSYCGLRYNKEGKFISLSSSDAGILDYYLDPLPCNCCASWFCPAGTGAGFPEFAAKKERETGYYNLSVFFYGCSFDCLFCQNKSHKNIRLGSKVSSENLIKIFNSNKKITCICFFGGSPEPQFPFALRTSEKIMEITKKEGRIARICWEWNGFGSQKFVKKAAELSLLSGGNIKFDLKAWNPNIHKALTGVDNKKVLENFEFVAKEYFQQRPKLPVLNATTLLVPGYIDEEEVEQIASFISALDENIPYSLLGFYPHHEFRDLPLTSRSLAERCFSVARKYLKNVNIGNKHLLV